MMKTFSSTFHTHLTELCYDILQDSEIIVILMYIDQKRFGLSYFSVFLMISGV